jgi:hypothetical protein
MCGDSRYSRRKNIFAGHQRLSEEGLKQPTACVVTGGKARLQPGAQCHQFIDLSDNAVLFGDGWDGHGQLPDQPDI